MSASTPSFNPGDPVTSPPPPELNQSGKMVLVAGASAGIVFAIAKAFAEASTSRVVLTGRRSDVLQRAAPQLSISFLKTEFFHGQETLLKVDLDATWSLYDTNARSLLDFSQRFHAQEGPETRQKKIAEEVDRKKLQIVSFHPGQILSETARSAGLDENSAPFDDGASRTPTDLRL
ncbi:hypothetical protein EDB81DRAFT_846732 [Dactylonectria macrodidyma]|uniref:Uncharacterized protein n=1 Tax=Dactylonectria macrodidyma TaxID=307937 RepID=A0A9P9DW35_9HYPO|nr:hypothetical protein EDB81DRAFT_846732 [Dactylonectria macrodidyma]